ncbi:hypothetical protein [Paractinoplanes abujensis]|uniref:Uncharacterized protein n=1 Tax=Paractinoplanes abujensis TaxID=882441 RepID=A0A7W7G0T5_9ACTN|nr:hypothetical protein [Actinoplanes abujensis]MBB4691914.1 hypothetical protein [Actinoplanes abujensis]
MSASLCVRLAPRYEALTPARPAKQLNPRRPAVLIDATVSWAWIG